MKKYIFPLQNYHPLLNSSQGTMICWPEPKYGIIVPWVSLLFTQSSSNVTDCLTLGGLPCIFNSNNMTFLLSLLRLSSGSICRDLHVYSEAFILNFSGITLKLCFEPVVKLFH